MTATPKAGQPYNTTIGLADVNAPGDFLDSPTITAGDFKVSINRGALVNLNTLPSVIPAGSGNVEIDFNAAEMVGPKLVLKIKDPDGEWTDVKIVIDIPTLNIDDILQTVDLDTSLTDIHLDHFFATDYDPSSIPGVAGAWANEAVEDDGQAAMRFTSKMLENIAVSGGGFITAPWKWDTNTAESDPGSGKVKANNVTFASITEVYINQLTDGGGNASQFIEALDDGDTLVLARSGLGSNFVIFDISGVPVDNGSFYTISGTVSDSGGSFGNNNTIDVTFAYQADDAATIASAVWNALRSAHRNAGSFGIATLNPLAVGTAQGGTASTIQLASSESFATNLLRGNVVKIIGGTGVGQSRFITGNITITDTVSITPDWTTTPDSTSLYEIVEGVTSMEAILGSALEESSTGILGTNFDFFYDNNNSTTTKVVDDVGGVGGPSGSGFITLTWIWSTATSGIPNAGRIRGNNAVIASITELSIHEETDDGQNASLVIGELKSGDKVAVYFPAAASANFLIFDVSAVPIKTGNIWAVTGTVSDDDGTFTNTSANVVFQFVQSTRTADAVWDELKSAHILAGSFGLAVGDIDTETGKIGTITDLGAGATIGDNLADMAGATFLTTTDSQEAIRNNQRGTDNAFLAASAPTNFSSLVITAGGAVDSLVQGFLNTLIIETSVGNIAANFDNLYDNGDALATLTLDTISTLTAAGLLTTQLVESYRATNAVPTLAEAVLEIIAHMGESSNSGTTKTLKKVDGSTTAKTYTYDDAANPTSITETT